MARQWATARHLTLTELERDPLEYPAVAANAEDRCYHCKHALFSSMLQSLAPRAILCDGTNASDLGTHRPGLRAVRELGVRSPLAEAGLDKAHIHELAALTGMERPAQRPRPCLLTRFAYGLHPTRELLLQLAHAEEAVAGLFSSDPDAVPDFRLRLPELHRLELHCAQALSPSLQSRIRAALAALGLPAPEFVHLQAVSGYYDAHTRHSNA